MLLQGRQSVAAIITRLQSIGRIEDRQSRRWSSTREDLVSDIALGFGPVAGAKNVFNCCFINSRRNPSNY